MVPFQQTDHMVQYVSLTCFFLSFLPGELLTKRAGKFDKTANLLGKHVIGGNQSYMAFLDKES